MTRLLLTAWALLFVWPTILQAQTAQLLLGDANGDGTVTIADVAAMVRYLNNTTFRLVQFEAADTDGDDAITLADIKAVTLLVLSGEKKYRTLSLHQGHRYVDLGLDVKWATCNVGAAQSEQSGGYYAWGETATKSEYSWDTYTLCNGSYNSMKRYNPQSSYGTVDALTTLTPADDVARTLWQGTWRMPTSIEIGQLRNRCTWTWVSNYRHSGMNGYIVRSKRDGYTDRFIFLPAAGYMYYSSLCDVGDYGDYWSSSLRTSYPDDAATLYFCADYHTADNCNRYCGFTVRAVCQP